MVPLRAGSFLGLVAWAQVAGADEPPAEPRAPPALEKPAPAPPVDVISGAGPSGPAPPRRVQDSPSLAAQLRWRWPEFRTYQYVLVSVQVAAAIASLAIPGGERFQGDNAFDEAARDALRVKIPEGGRYARDASDVGLVLLVNQRFVDNLIVTWWWHDKGSTAWQMTMIDVQTVSFAASINSLVAGAAGRQRPYGTKGGYCERSPEAESTDCQGNNEFRSFFSGHATAAFTLASLTCMHHMHLPLYGRSVASRVLPCVSSMSVAAGVSVLRVSADQHYLSDVLTGAAFGTLSGFFVPYAFHYAHDESEEKADGGAPRASILPTATGLGVFGVF